MFYVELYHKGIYTITFRFSSNILGRFNFIKKDFKYIFPLDMYGAINSIFNYFGIPNNGINFNINLYRRPGTYFDLYYFNLVYNFIIVAVCQYIHAAIA